MCFKWFPELLRNRDLANVVSAVCIEMVSWFGDWILGFHPFCMLSGQRVRTVLCQKAVDLYMKIIFKRVHLVGE